MKKDMLEAAVEQAQHKTWACSATSCRSAQASNGTVRLEECEARTEVDAQTLNRAAELLARWILRRGQKG